MATTDFSLQGDDVDQDLFQRGGRLDAEGGACAWTEAYKGRAQKQFRDEVNSQGR